MIEGTAFAIDHDGQLLRRIGIPEHTITFHELKDEGSYYVLLFDRKNKCLYRGMGEAEQLERTTRRIIIPEAVLENHAPLHDDDIDRLNELSIRSGFGIRIVKNQAKLKPGNKTTGTFTNRKRR